MESNETENSENDSSEKPTAYLQETVRGIAGKIYHLRGVKALIGRNPEAEIPISSCSVSRSHAMLNYTKKGWTITDSSSINGVYVNGQKLEPNEPHLLKSGQIIFLGPPDVAEYIFTYHLYTSPKPRRKKKVLVREADSTVVLDGSSTSKSVSKRRSCRNKGSPDKTDKKVCLNNDTGIDNEKSLEEQLASIASRIKEHDELEERIKKKLGEEEEEENKTDIKSEISSILADSESLIPASNQDEPIPDSNHDYWEFPGGDDIFNFISSQPPENKKMTELESQLETLKKQLQEKEQLKADLLKKLEEKDSVLKEQEQQQKLLEVKMKEEMEVLASETKSLEQNVKKEIANEFGNVMESEFTCSICTEFFVKATTLECAHTFCNKCITQWKKTKKQCPICRKPISGETRSFVIDNLIDKLVEKSAPEIQEKRKAVLKEHEEEEKKKPVVKGKAKKRGRSRRGQSRRGGTFSNPGNIPNYLNGNPMLLNFGFGNHSGYANELAVLNQIFTDVVASDDSDSDYYEDSYDYGGYGRCYNCGGSGHWANTCPH